VRVRSAHFEVLSDASPQRARGAAVALERFRRVLATVLGRGPGQVDPPTIVVAFRDQDSFAPFRPSYRGRSLEVEGYFQAGADRDYIAVSLGSDPADAGETLFHEYGHVLLNRTLSAQPLWLAEGLAEVFSRWGAGDAEALVGRPAAEHLRRLQKEKPLPIDQLLELDYTSPLYNEGEQRGIFYAQSWALAHWVLLGRGASGPADLQVFLAAITAGVDPPRAFASAFGASSAAAEKLLASYVASPLPVGRFAVEGLDADITVESAAPPRAEVEFRLGDLLLHAGRLAEARRRLERAIEADPRFGPAHAALGHVAVRLGRWEEARREVALALAADPKDAVALFRYAELLVRETAARGEVLSPEREGC
jgi:tetratricopeptide (TPR) repeat protein